MPATAEALPGVPGTTAAIVKLLLVPEANPDAAAVKVYVPGVVIDMDQNVARPVELVCATLPEIETDGLLESVTVTPESVAAFP